MSQAETQSWSGDHNASEMAEYRSVSRLAVFGLLLGIASILAWFGPYAWPIPVVALVVCAASLFRIGRSELGLTGRKAALCGICLALISGIGAPTRYFSYRYLVQREGLQFTEQWFEHVRNGDIIYAHQMALPISQRRPVDDALLEYYRDHPDLVSELKKYSNYQIVRTLLELGDRADVRLYRRFGVSNHRSNEELLDEYAVTFEDNGVKKSFFLYVLSERHYNSFRGRGQWRIADIRVGKPDAIRGEAAEEETQANPPADV